jgi:PucR C-terminal helix-turn-helix domain/GGDEF-like domain
MSRNVRSAGRSLEEVRAGLVTRLRARRTELVEAIFARVRAVPDPVGDEDAEYVAGLRAAIAAAVDHSLTSIEQGEEWSESIPPAATAQARRSVRHGVSLDTVLRRYVAGDRVLEDFVMDEADRFPREALRQVLRTQAALLDHLMASIATEYVHEVERAGRSPEQRRAESVQRLLAGDPVGPGELDYQLDAWHLGVIATGARAAKAAVESLAEGLGCQLLIVPYRDESVWAWFGGQRRLAVADIERLLSDMSVAGVSLAVGESGTGIAGWRLTHWQAQRALWVALREPRMLTRYTDVLLLAPALRDDVLARSLKEIFLSPLGGQRDGGAVSRETLRTYFAVGRNAATAAAALKVDRHTVERRVHRIEESLGRALHTCQAELEVALRLEALSDAADADNLSLMP